MTDWERFACELGSIGALAMLESRLERITRERDEARAEVDRLRGIIAGANNDGNKKAIKCPPST